MGKRKNSINEVEITENVVPTPVNNNVDLEILIAFTDKYSNKKYKAGDVITVDKLRATELLTDSRKLVVKK